MPPLLLRQPTLNDDAPSDVSVHVWPGCPRIVRLLLADVAARPWQLKLGFEFAPKGFTIIVVLPSTGARPTVLIPHEPLHE